MIKLHSYLLCNLSAHLPDDVHSRLASIGEASTFQLHVPGARAVVIHRLGGLAYVQLAGVCLGRLCNIAHFSLTDTDGFLADKLLTQSHTQLMRG
jgi:hypothetical protein